MLLYYIKNLKNLKKKDFSWHNIDNYAINCLFTKLQQKI